MKFTSLRVTLLALALCSAALSTPSPAAEGCERSGVVQFVCGPSAAEDIVRVAGTRWLIASGLAEGKTPGRLHLIDSVNKQWQIAFPGANVGIREDHRRFPDCASPPDESQFSAHGIAIRRTGHTRHSLLVINHGREAVEFFIVDSRGERPQLTWVGCVPMPPDIYLNSVAHLPDGGFVTTQFYSPSKGGMNSILTGALTGGVLEWHPGKKVTPIAGTDLSGANGIETSHGGRVLYVNAWGAHQIVRFDRRGATLKKDVVSVDFAPDNLRWNADGTQLIVAGQKLRTGGSNPLEMVGWSTAYVSPETLAVTPIFNADASMPLQGVSVALEVDGLLWVGPFRGDRVGYLPLPH
jgi:hypothetical protein